MARFFFGFCWELCRLGQRNSGGDRLDLAGLGKSCLARGKSWGDDWTTGGIGIIKQQVMGYHGIFMEI